jgi:ribosome biogenesis GTPase
MTGLVVSLDRGYPLVRTARGERRAQHAIELVKNASERACVGDIVELSEEPGQDTLLITAIRKRTSVLARRELVQSIHEGSGKVKEQVLAANFDFVAVVQSLGAQPLKLDYLERQLVMANQSGVEVIVLLTKRDLAQSLESDCAAARAVAPASTVYALAKTDAREVPELHEGLAALAAHFAQGKLGVLLGKSGAGKSTLVNLLLGEERQETGSVRGKDSVGRHTTVARRLVDLPAGGAIIDTPGMRALGVEGATLGLARTFPDITAAAAECRYRDCTHTHEPDCAVMEAVTAGLISARRLASYCSLAVEVYD